MIDLKQGSTQRGVIRVIVFIAATYAWFTGNMEQAVGAFTLGELAKGYIGITKDELGVKDDC